MKKLILILVFVAAYSAASLAYTYSATLSCIYIEPYKELWVNNMNATTVFYRLHSEGSYAHHAYTHTGIRLYTNKNAVHTKMYWVYDGVHEYTRTISAPSGQIIVRAKLQASGEEVWENHNKYTFNTKAEAYW